MKKLFTILCIAICLNVSANTINVPAQDSTIQAGINSSNNGDTILVANGTYYETNITFGGKEVVLLSENGPLLTIIDGSNSGGIFDCNSGETFNTEINGFTIQNGQANEGAAIHIINSSYLTVKNCIVKNNLAPGTWTRAAITIGQAYNNGPHTPAGIHMYDCLLEGNSGYYGGGVFNGESGSIASVYQNCIFKNNTGTAGAAIFGTRNSLIQYCLFYNNTSSQGTSIINNEGGSPQVTNCTFADNSGYAFCRNSNTLNTVIRNCIFYGNTGTWCQVTNASTIVMEFCNDEDNNAGPGNINQNPLFVNSSAYDYTLQASSPCIDAGDTSSQYNDPDGTINDMGAYYYHQILCSDTTISDTITYIVDDILFASISPLTYLDSIDSLNTQAGGCDSILRHYTKFVYNASYCTDTIIVQDTNFVTDTTFITINDTITYYDTVLVSVTDTLIIDITLTGIAPPNNINTIKVYPNPANDIVIIDNGNYANMSNYTLKIVNSLGQDVFNSLITIPQFQIPVNTLGTTGLYFIQILDPRSQIIDTRKLILN